MDHFYRVKKERKINWKIPLLIGLFSFSLMALIYFVLNSPWLKVKEINIQNPLFGDKEFSFTSLSSKVIELNKWRALLGPDHLIFWLGIDQEKILNSLPYLVDLKIKVDLWRQKLNISFQERKLEGVLCLVYNGQCFAFDKNGVIFKNVPKFEGYLILKVFDENLRAILIGYSLLPEKDWLKNFQEIISEVKESDLKIKEIRIKSFGLREWEIILASGLILKMSFENRPQNLKEIIHRLSQQVDFNQLEYIDFRIPNRLYYK